MAKSPKTIHVTPGKDGAWTVRSAAARAGRVFATQAEAVLAAQARVREVGGELYVHTGQGQPKKSFTLGRAAMAKLNAVEGVALTPAARSAFKDFDRQDLSPAKRRATLRTDLVTLAAAPKGKSARGARQSSTSKV